MKDFLTWVYVLRSCIFTSVALLSLIVFLCGRKKHGKAFRAVTLGLVGINLLFIAIGSYNAFLRPHYQQQPITRNELETLCAKLADGSYDPEQFLPNCENKDLDPHGHDIEWEEDMQGLINFTSKIVYLKSGWISQMTELESDIYLNFYEFDTVAHSQSFYRYGLDQYWNGNTNYSEEGKTKDRETILQNGYLEIENTAYCAYLTPVEYQASYFNPEQGDHISKRISIVIRYDRYVACFIENSHTNGLVLPNMVKNQLLFDPSYDPNER